MPRVSKRQHQYASDIRARAAAYQEAKAWLKRCRLEFDIAVHKYNQVFGAGEAGLPESSG